MLELLNVKDGEVVHYPLFLLCCRGFCKACPAAVRNVSEQVEETSENCLVDDVLVSLVFLKPGNNTYEISSQSDSVKVTICYAPSKSKRIVRLVYVTCLNEEKFQGPLGADRSVNEAVRRIQTGCLVLQTFLAETLAAEGLGRKTFTLDMTPRGVPKVHVLQIPLTIKEAHRYSDEKLWQLIAIQILSSSLGDPCCKYLAFFSGTRFTNSSGRVLTSEKEVLSMTKGHISLGGGGLAVVGTGALYSWASSANAILENFASTRKIDSYLMDFSAGRSTWGACYGTHLGSVLHELAHTFDLGHSTEGIMGRGFENLHLLFTSPHLYLSNRTSPKHSITSCSKPSKLLEKDGEVFAVEFVKTNGSGEHTGQPSHSVHLAGDIEGTSDSAEGVPNPGNSAAPHALKRASAKDKKNGNKTLNKDVHILHSPWAHNSNADNPFLRRSSQLSGHSFWLRSQAVMLAYHRWFNDGEEGEAPYLKGNILRSKHGVVLIELRDTRSYVFHYWDYSSLLQPPQLVYIPWSQVQLWPEDNNVEVVAIDKEGNILKGCIINRPL